jgi:hypothetical protein
MNPERLPSPGVGETPGTKNVVRVALPGKADCPGSQIKSARTRERCANRKASSAKGTRSNRHELRSSPERVNDGSCGHERDFALLHPLECGGEVSPTTPRLLPVIDNTSFAFIDLG